jgi:hypothetical protein
MDVKRLAEWIDARICGTCKQGYTCDDFDCEQAREIADILKKLVPFEGKDADGNNVSGMIARD